MRFKVFKVECRDVANKFIHGRIAGIIYALEGKPLGKNKRLFPIEVRKDRVILKTYTTKCRYLMMRKHIEALYPGICGFDD